MAGSSIPARRDGAGGAVRPHYSQRELDRRRFAQQLVDALGVPARITDEDGTVVAEAPGFRDSNRGARREVRSLEVEAGRSWRVATLIPREPAAESHDGREADSAGEAFTPVQRNAGSDPAPAAHAPTMPPAPAPVASTGASASANDDLLQSMIDALPAMLSAKDRESRYLVMNAYHAQVYGTTPAQAIGRRAADLFGEAHGRYVRSRDVEVLESGVALAPYEEAYRDCDGVMRHWLTTKVPLREPGGTVYGVATVSLDITERKRLERELADARWRAEEANRAKGNFLAHMSHELRTPLNAILGFSEIIDTQLLGPVGNRAYQGYAHDILSAGQHLLELINEVLDLAKLQAGGSVLDPEWIDVRDAVDAALPMVELAAKRKRLDLKAELAEPLPWLYADRRRVRQILLNLLSNAVKFTPEGGRVLLRGWVEEDGRLALVVSDTGAGIPSDTLEHIFEPFAKGDPAATRRHGGTGLGLPLTKSLVEAHGGCLELASAVGEGTEACVFFPPTRVGRPSIEPAPGGRQSGGRATG